MVSGFSGCFAFHWYNCVLGWRSIWNYESCGIEIWMDGLCLSFHLLFRVVFSQKSISLFWKIGECNIFLDNACFRMWNATRNKKKPTWLVWNRLFLPRCKYKKKKKKKRIIDGGVWPNRVLYIIYSSATDRNVITISYYYRSNQQTNNIVLVWIYWHFVAFFANSKCSFCSSNA